MRKLLLYWNTLKYLKLKQIIYQLRYRLFPSMHSIHFDEELRMGHLALLIPELDLDKEYLSRFHIDKIQNNIFVFLNKEATLDLKKWENDSMTPLWNFNLHYFEYAIALGAESNNKPEYYAKFRELFLAWISANPYGSMPAWNSYVISLRVVNLLIAMQLFCTYLDRDTVFSKILYNSIYKQYRVLIKRQEYHLLGNHYFENIKTILIGSFLFREQNIQKHYITILNQQIVEQVLPDGMHFERSVMYHKLFLEGLLRIWVSANESDIKHQLLPIIQTMADALFTMEYRMGKIAHFNDSVDGIAKSDFAILHACERLCSIKPVLKTTLPSAGYYRLDSERIATVIDCGIIAPQYIPGHGHCDALSFELSVDGKPIFINSGTYGYQGTERRFIRSTKAHNTITIGGVEQSECWGEHRVARRIKNVRCEPLVNGYRGMYRNYIGDLHIREFRLLSESNLLIKDIIMSSPFKDIKSYLHVHPKYKIERSSDEKFGVYRRGSHDLVCQIIVSQNCHTRICGSDEEISQYFPQFGQILKKDVLEIFWNSSEYESCIIIRINKGVFK